MGMFPGALLCLSPRWAQARFDDLRFFAAMQNPATLTEHVRETFGLLS
ncbi:Epoxide hydrolase [Pseudomonas amygdali pv. mellea]|nr:Epoxide hydrolase [Pseudomonas amygdali]KPX83047.1 Epoxide hydrolase [Pseudomonas amygdali pv. mellea]